MASGTDGKHFTPIKIKNNFQLNDKNKNEINKCIANYELG
jgi:hypothetical protein